MRGVPVHVFKSLVFRAIRRAAVTLISILFLPLWFSERLIPRKKTLWVFGSFDGKGFTDNSRSFFEYMQKNHSEIKCAWITRSRDVCSLLRSYGFKCEMAYSLKGWLLQLFAGAFFNDHGNGDYNYHALNGAKIVSLWHGMPMKKMGVLYDEYLMGKKFLLFRTRLSWVLFPWRRKNFSLVPVLSEFFIPYLQASFGNPFGKPMDKERFQVLGLPRNDALLSHGKNLFVEKIRGEFPQSTVVFYLPTFRLAMYTDEPFNPFCPQFGFDEKEFSSFLERNNLVFLYKPHPYETFRCDSKIPRFKALSEGDVLNLYEFLADVDVLLTDYSSVYFDFKITGKPVALLPFDFESYVSIRGLFFDYWNEIPDFKAKSWGEFYSGFEEGKIVATDEKKFNRFVDASSSERVFDSVKRLLKI